MGWLSDGEDEGSSFGLWDVVLRVMKFLTSMVSWRGRRVAFQAIFEPTWCPRQRKKMRVEVDLGGRWTLYPKLQYLGVNGRLSLWAETILGSSSLATRTDCPMPRGELGAGRPVSRRRRLAGGCVINEQNGDEGCQSSDFRRCCYLSSDDVDMWGKESVLRR